MYIENDICFADSKRAPMKIVAASNVGDYLLKVLFNDGQERLFDGHALEGVVFEPLMKDVMVFQSWKLDYETLTWQDGAVDIAPEFVYDHSTLV